MVSIARLIAVLLLLAASTAALQAQTPETVVTGAGATFPYPMYAKWFDTYHRLHPAIDINYQSIGSGGGIKEITEGKVDFGATDGAMTDAQIKTFEEKRHCKILHFPTVLGAEVPIYNIPGVKAELKFTPEALAGIFLGKITKWNDPAIQGENPEVHLPNLDIVVVHRSDGSGTTYLWTDYLSKVSAEWKQKVGVGTAVKWPVGQGVKVEGVGMGVRQTEGSIGYVELVYAQWNKIPYGSVKNSAGKFIKADLASVTAAAAASKIPDDFRASITNAPGEKSYPISGFTWLLVPDRIEDPAKRQIIVDFLKWMLDDGQKMTGDLQYANLPREIVDMEKKAIEKIH